MTIPVFKNPEKSMTIPIFKKPGKKYDDSSF
jgi:hypothetical protein